LSNVHGTDLKGKKGDLKGKRKAFHECDSKVLLPREDFCRMSLRDDCSSASFLRVTSLLKEK